MGDGKGLKDKAREHEATDSDAGDLGGEGEGLEGPEDKGNRSCPFEKSRLSPRLQQIAVFRKF